MSDIFNRFNRHTKILAIIAIACLIVTILLSANTIKYYTEDKATVNAKISFMELYDNSADGDSDWGYKVYVDYSYMDKEYNDIYYGEVSKKTKLNEGDRINIEIYEDNPDEVANNTFVNIWFFLAAFIFLLIIMVKSSKKDIKSSK